MALCHDQQPVQGLDSGLLETADGEFVEDKDPEMMGVLSIDAYREGQVQASLHESVYEALNSLPEKHRQMLTLHYLGGMAVTEDRIHLKM